MDQINYTAKTCAKIHHTIEKDGKRTEYKPLRLRETFSEEGLDRQVSLEWINYFRDIDKHPEPLTKNSIKRLKIRTVNICWDDETGNKKVAQISIAKALENVRQYRYFAQKELDIPENAKLPWPDRVISATMDHYWPDNQNNIKGDTTVLTIALGDNFPLSPAIDREGFCYAPLLKVLYGSIINSRNYIVENSNHMFGPEDLWLQHLFNYLNSVISLVESTMVQIHYKAKFDPKNENGVGQESGLKFDSLKMGSTITGRSLDKIHWLYLCTGRHLEKIDEELRQIKMLKEVRNHINHFDPPVFACTAEDVARWLNVTKYVGNFIWKVRRLLQLPPSQDLCSILFLPTVVFTPRNPNHNRGIQKPVVGYESSRWPSSTKGRAIATLSAEQCRGARGMLNWTQEQLAIFANLSTVLIEKFESGESCLTSIQIEALIAKFKTANIVFLSPDENGEGIRLSKI